MKVNLFYNDFKKEIDIDISKKIGIIQENLLNCCSLLIYNIEYSDRDGNNISVHNMVYVFNYNYLKFIPLDSFYRLKYYI